MCGEDIVQQRGYICLRGREGIFEKRRRREKISQQKEVLAERAGRLLSFIPTIRLIGISGSVAMRNADEDDDLDLFIITRSGTLWLTRFFTVFLLTLFQLRRKRKGSRVKNTVCVNLLLDEQMLQFTKERRDLYTAHEIIQMKPLVNKRQTYEAFLKSNEWVREFLPNSMSETVRMRGYERPGKRSVSSFLTPLEWVAKTAQVWYMRNHRTTETVSDVLAAFHPFDARRRVLEAFQKRCDHYV